jgi:hypothetical protein
MLRIKDENELVKLGLRLDAADPTKAGSLDGPSNPSRVVSIGQAADLQQGATSAENLPGNAKSNTEIKQPATDDSPRSAESFTRETSTGTVGDLSTWDDQAVLAEIKKECADIRVLDGSYPAQYHRLGTLIIEARKRFGDENVKQSLRQEGIDNARAWRAEQIAKLYTFDQAAAFPSLRAILRTLPAKQPRDSKSKLKGGGDHQATVPQKPPQIPPSAANDENIVGRFIQLGIEVRALFGDEALDQAIEQMKAHVPETFEEAFAEV